MDESTGKIVATTAQFRARRVVDFIELCQLLQRLGFEMRVSGSHQFFRKTGISEAINLQPHGGKAKNYQVRQARKVLQSNRLL